MRISILRQVFLWFLISMILISPLFAGELTQVGSTVFVLETFFPGIRSAGMGGADFAFPQGPMAIMQSPAIPLEGIQTQVGYEHANYLLDINVSQMAAAYEWRNFRFGMARHQNALRDFLAMNPYGDSIRTDSVQQVYTTGVSAEILPKWRRKYGVAATVGVSWRHYRSEVISSKASANDADLGLSLRWREVSKHGWLGADLSAMSHNFLGSDFSMEEDSARLPGYNQYGFALSGAWQPDPQTWEIVRVILAYTHRQERNDNDRRRYHDDRWGFEATAMELLALRWGESDHQIWGGRSTTAGAGIIIPRRWIAPLEIRLDWARMDSGILQDSVDTYGLTLATGF